jgi:hypothetical protein
MMTNDILAIRSAIKSAQHRTGDSTLATKMQCGRVQIVRVTYKANGVGIVEPVSDWVAVSDACGVINSL